MEHICTLNELPVNQPAKVISVLSKTESSFARRLKSMGIKPFATIQVIQKSWFTPLKVCVGMTEYMIRKRDAENIFVEYKDT
jgi:Fe2+ transport system protein FeoA